MTPRATKRLSALFGKVKRVSDDLRVKHRIDCLRDDVGAQRDIFSIIGEINRCCRRKQERSAYPGAVSFAARFASDYFRRGKFASPISATRYLSYLFGQAESVRCRYQSDLEMFFWRLQNGLSKRVNSERRKAKRTATSQPQS